MSHGPGSMQRWIIEALRLRDGNGEPPSTAELVGEYANEHRWRRKTQDALRSIRHSMLRALRSLEADKKVARFDLYGVTYWTLAGRRGRPKHDPRRVATAYHEAGHAVIGLAKQLPITIATIHAKGRRYGYVTGLTDRLPVGEVTRLPPGQKWGLHETVNKKTAHLDAFGNPIRKRVIGEVEHHSEVIMCIAGPMAHMIHQGNDPMKWRDRASSSDMWIARHHRRRLGHKAKSWEEYEQETLALLRKLWRMVEAVAARLLKDEVLSGYDLDLICRGVVRRQHLKDAK